MLIESATTVFVRGIGEIRSASFFPSFKLAYSSGNDDINAFKNFFLSKSLFQLSTAEVAKVQMAGDGRRGSE